MLKTAHFNFSKGTFDEKVGSLPPSRLNTGKHVFSIRVENSVEPDQVALSGAR